MNDFFNMSGSQIILISALTALLLADGLTADEQRTLGDFLMCVGQNIIASSDQKTLLENKTTKTTKTNNTDNINIDI